MMYQISIVITFHLEIGCLQKRLHTRRFKIFIFSYKICHLLGKNMDGTCHMELGKIWNDSLDKNILPLLFNFSWAGLWFVLISTEEFPLMKIKRIQTLVYMISTCWIYLIGLCPFNYNICIALNCVFKFQSMW